MDLCTPEPIYNYVLGIALCLGGLISYVPQYYSLIKYKTTKGISELSLLVLNLSSAFLAVNALIFNWWKFSCYSNCSFWICTGNLLSFYQIVIGWLAVFPLYVLFVRYKIKESDRRFIRDGIYLLVYILFMFAMVIIGVSDDLYDKNAKSVLKIFAYVMGVLSAILSVIIWVPQIVKLLRTRSQGNLSLAMFLVQTPGNAVIIGLQILYHQSWSTWICYVVVMLQQITIVIILIVFKCKSPKTEEILIINDDPESDLLLSDSSSDESSNESDNIPPDIKRTVNAVNNFYETNPDYHLWKLKK